MPESEINSGSANRRVFYIQVTMPGADFHCYMEEIHYEAYHDEIGLLTAEDMAFIHETLGRDILSEEEVNAIVNDPQMRNRVLDSPAIFDALGADITGLNVSEFFYYSTLVRQVMLNAGLDAEEYTQNVASSLVRMANMKRKHVERSDFSCRYLPLDMEVLVEEGRYGCNITISARMEPYDMKLEGFVANISAFSKKDDEVFSAAKNQMPQSDAA